MKFLKIFKTAGRLACCLTAALTALGGIHLAAGQSVNLNEREIVWNMPAYDKTKPTALIIADPKSTEMFDMLAPFYIFSSTGKMNVFIVSKEKAPVLIKKDLYVLPQLSFKQADSLGLTASVIVAPALSRRDDKQDPAVVSFIKDHYAGTTRLLAVCDGASTAAATGLYDGIPITCHASDFAMVSSHFSKPRWIKDVNVAHSGNLYSTAGVSNAVEGSLTVISDLFGPDVMKTVAAVINYPHPEILTAHQSTAIKFDSEFNLAIKPVSSQNRKLGVYLQNGISEFELVSILDTYGRSFPKVIKGYTSDGMPIHTRYGLIILCTGDNDPSKADEIHLLTAPGQSAASCFGKAVLVTYDQKGQYPIDVCLKRIGELYGSPFKNIVKLMLDYN